MKTRAELPMLYRLRGVRVDFPGRTALEVPELSIRAGSLTVLVGGNGAGKTTLLKVLVGL
ncbi:MAG: ATP-binding cassette domain-containing protein, partial [Candidatus Binatia bacterium]